MAPPRVRSFKNRKAGETEIASPPASIYRIANSARVTRQLLEVFILHGISDLARFPGVGGLDRFEGDSTTATHRLRIRPDRLQTRNCDHLLFRNEHSQSLRSEITQPSPIAMPAAKVHKPAARQVKDSDGHDPHGVNERQTMTVSQRLFGKVGDDRAMPDGLMEG